MHAKALPALAKMQKDKGKLDNEPVIDNLFPTFYGSGLVKGDLYLVFQVKPVLVIVTLITFLLGYHNWNWV